MKKNNRLLDRAKHPYPLMASLHRWKYSALAMAAAVSVGLYAPDAAALVLGPITVQSALGEPLRAEIDLPQITPAEADSLKASTASADAFRAQGMEYSSTAKQVQLQVLRRPNGRTVLRLSSNSAVNEPFVDLVIDARWSTGQITRSYTMLFDPPALRRAPATVTAEPQITAAAPSPAPTPSATPDARSAAETAPRPAVKRATKPAPRTAPAPAPDAAATPTRTPAPVARAPASAASDSAVTVASGDTAGRIATAHRASGVSLDQMLVAMMRTNPDAFIQGNVNRIKAGAVLQIPSTDEARTTPPNEARQIIAVQSRDFNAFRRKLARAAPATQQAAAERSAKGSVQTQTDDKRTAATTPDKLTLSKGALQGKKTTEELLAQRKQGNEASARVEELSKNIEELNRISAASTPAAAAASASAAATASAGAPGITVANPGITLPATAAPETPAPAAPVATAPETPAPAAAPETPASAEPAVPPAPTEAGAPAEAAAPEPAVVAIAPSPATPLAVPAPEAAPSFLSELMEDPMVPLAGGGLLALLLGYGAYRVIQRRRQNPPLDSSFMDSRVQPDSFFGGSGGQRVDTAGNDSTTGGSSLAFTSSQLDAGGDVDPVAEADVYLAYGRDLQAEEILKEAVRHNPERISVHAKLAEIYAKRQDRKAFEATAHNVHQLTQGSGTDWTRVADLGRELDPENALYQPGGVPGAAATAQDSSSAVSAATSGLASPAAAATVAAATGAAASLADSGGDDLDFDLDLNFLDDTLTDVPTSEPVNFAEAAGAAAAETAAAPAPRAPAAPLPETEDDFELPALDFGSPADEPTWNAPATPPAAPLAPAKASEISEDTLGDIDFSLDLPALDISPATQPASEPAKDSFVLPESGMMDFDLDDLSLDLDAAQSSLPAGPSATNAAPPLPLSDDPLATKLALAQEFNTIGDSDGARTLIEEVIAESSGELKARAQRLLSELD